MSPRPDMVTVAFMEPILQKCRKTAIEHSDESSPKIRFRVNSGGHPRKRASGQALSSRKFGKGATTCVSSTNDRLSASVFFGRNKEGDQNRAADECGDDGEGPSNREVPAEDLVEPDHFEADEDEDESEAVF